MVSVQWISEHYGVRKMKNDLYELTRKRRSVRRYGDKHIDDEIISEIMKVALTAPTSFGHKPVEYVLVRDRDMIRKIGVCKQMGGSQINSADAVIVVMVKTANKRQAEFWIEDGAIASSYILLAVEQYGLGACWVHIRNRMGKRGTSDQEIRALLGVPDGYSVLNLVAIGEKGETKKAYTDADLHTENVHYEKY
jgi:nitroreductase